jgi:hypothetical protein
MGSNKTVKLTDLAKKYIANLPQLTQKIHSTSQKTLFPSKKDKWLKSQTAGY